jgi:lipoprotein-anchoring transpeptidase ErfK/SrfK
VLLVGGAASLTLALAGCNSSGQPDQLAARAPYPKAETLSAAERAAASPRYMALYGAVSDRFPIHALKPGVVPDMFWRSEVDYVSSEQPGSIIVDPRAHYLYFVLSGDRAMRYGVGVGKEGFGWNGVATIKSKQEWPDWYPPMEMIERDPSIKERVGALQSGIGVPGGLTNPLGARAMYLWQGNKDTLFRIHGTLEPWTIGKNVSSGCIRMVNQDVIDLYNRVAAGATVKVI